MACRSSSIAQCCCVVAGQPRKQKGERPIMESLHIRALSDRDMQHGVAKAYAQMQHMNGCCRVGGRQLGVGRGCKLQHLLAQECVSSYPVALAVGATIVILMLLLLLQAALHLLRCALRSWPPQP